jgi:hypothetical protein
VKVGHDLLHLHQLACCRSRQRRRVVIATMARCIPCMPRHSSVFDRLRGSSDLTQRLIMGCEGTPEGALCNKAAYLPEEAKRELWSTRSVLDFPALGRTTIDE